MLPDMRGYLQLAGQLAAAGAGKATETVSTLMALGDRDALVALVRTEVDQVIGRMGLVREDELAALRRQVERLQVQLDQARASAAPPVPAPVTPADSGAAGTPDEATAAEPSGGDRDAAAEKPKKRKRPVADA